MKMTRTKSGILCILTAVVIMITAVLSPINMKAGEPGVTEENDIGKSGLSNTNSPSVSSDGEDTADISSAGVSSRLNAPDNLRWESVNGYNTLAKWDPVEGADKYDYSIKILYSDSGSTSSVSGSTSFTAANYIDLKTRLDELFESIEDLSRVSSVCFKVRAISNETGISAGEWSEYSGNTDYRPSKDQSGSDIYAGLSRSDNSGDSGYLGDEAPNSTIVFPEISPISNLVYNGTALALVIPPAAGTVPAGYKIQYALGENAETAPETGYADTVPSAIKADTYYVWYKYTGADSTYADSSARCVTALIAKKPATITAGSQTVGKGDVISQNVGLATAAGLVSGDKLYSITLSLTESASTSSTGTFNGVIKPSAAVIASSASMDVSSCYEITYNNGNLTVDEKPIAKNDLVYNGASQQLVTAGPSGYVYSTTEAGTYSETIPTGKNAGDYTVFYKTGSDATTAAKVTVSIEKKPILLTVKSGLTKVYGAKDPSFSELGNILTCEDNGLVSPDTITDVVYGELARSAGEDVGEYTVTSGTLKSKNRNYRISFRKGVFTITQATLDTAKLDLTQEFKVPTVETSSYRINLSSLLMDGAQKISITTGGALGSVLSNLDINGKNLIMDVAKNNAGTTGTAELHVGCTNYKDYKITIKLISAGHTADVHLESAESGAVTNVSGVDSDGLDEYAGALTGESIEVDMMITPKAETTITPQTAVTQIKSIVSDFYSGFDSNKLVTEYLDISVKRTIISGTTRETKEIEDLERVVDIELSFDMTGKYLPIVTREHGGSSEKFTQLSSPPSVLKDKTYYISGYSGIVTLHIYSQLFSTYGISYTTNPSSTIIFDDGTTMKTIIAERGTYLEKPANPTRSGYTFIGWYDTSDDTKWAFATDSDPDVVYGDMTLGAKWTLNSSGSGSGSSTSSNSSNSSSSSTSSNSSNSSNSSSNNSSSSVTGSQSTASQSNSAGSARPAFTGDSVQTGDDMPSVIVWAFIMLLGIALTVLGACKAYNNGAYK